MIHGIDIKTAITLILAFSGLVGAAFGLVNAFVKHFSEFLVRSITATQKIVNAYGRLRKDLRRLRSPARACSVRVSSRVPLKPAPVQVGTLKRKSLGPGQKAM